MLPIPEVSFNNSGAAETTETSSGRAGGGRNWRVALASAVAILLVGGFVAFVAIGTPSPTITTSNTSITAGPDVIISSAVETSPSGFTLESSKPSVSFSGTQNSDWAFLGKSDGSAANVTVVAYASANASKSYFNRLVITLKGLAGYTDITSDLADFQQYGSCYGHGEDVGSIAVADGICTKGNVFLQVHLVSGVPFSDLEADLTGLMGALYQSAV